MDIKYSKQAIKYLSKMELQKRSSVIDKIKRLPFGDVKKMQNDKYAYRLRVSNIRVLFDRFDDYISVGKIKTRGDIYK
jgi:mRNA-degrading endonuclease RelE of RelBE toxin-antitoxin system